MNPVLWLQMTNMISYQGLVRTFPIYVDIGDKYWVGQSVSPNDKVRIEGEIDKDWNSVEVDVNKITVIK